MKEFVMMLIVIMLTVINYRLAKISETLNDLRCNQCQCVSTEKECVK